MSIDEPKKLEYSNKYVHSERIVDDYETLTPPQIDPDLLFQRFSYWEIQAGIAENQAQRDTAYYYMKKLRLEIGEKFGHLGDPPWFNGHLKAHRILDYYGRKS